jgi:hypothetical protein
MVVARVSMVVARVRIFVSLLGGLRLARARLRGRRRREDGRGEE